MMKFCICIAQKISIKLDIIFEKIPKSEILKFHILTHTMSAPQTKTSAQLYSDTNTYPKFN